jgi:hypothetical protein
MEVGDMVQIRRPDVGDLGTGIIINIDQDIWTTHVEVYSSNKADWFSSGELRVIKYKKP